MDIRSELANALHWSLTIPHHSVKAEVDGGLVTLRGVVNRAYEKSYAEAIARRVPGVVNVRNQIAVRAAAVFSPPTIRS